MKEKKLFSAVLSSIVALCLLCGDLTANVRAERLYTLDELLEMDNEEFFGLETDDTGKNCKEMYLQMKNDIMNSNGNSIYFYNSDINSSKKYRANVTEKKIKTLLGSVTDGNFISPIYILDLLFSGYDGGFSADMSMSFDAGKNDEEIIKLSKCFYCVNQVMDMDYMITDGIYPPARELNIEYGDVNLDEKVDLLDAVYINKGLTGEYDLTSGQKYIGDINSDGKLDIIDSILIRKRFMTEDEQEKAAKVVKQFEETEAPLPCDISGNNTTDIYDIIAVAESIIGKRELTLAQSLIADYNADGKVDLYDAIETAVLLF